MHHTLVEQFGYYGYDILATRHSSLAAGYERPPGAWTNWSTLAIRGCAVGAIPPCYNSHSETKIWLTVWLHPPRTPPPPFYSLQLS